MSPHPTSSMTTAVLTPLFEALENRGLSTSELLRSIDINADQALAPGQRMPIHQFDRLLEHLCKWLDDSSIGMQIGRHLDIRNFALLGFLLSSCQTAREALTILRRYYSLISDSRAPDIFTGHETIKVVFYVSPGSSAGNAARAELIASGIHTLGRSLGGKYYRLTGVGFSAPEPQHQQRLQDFFGLPLQYEQSQNWISFSSRHLDSPLYYGNPALFNELREQAERALNQFSQYRAFSRRVLYILHQWPENLPMTKDAVADLLSTSSRTLTRRLQEEDCQFSTLVKDVRLKKAKQALATTSTDVQQLAMELGFSDRRGFERAFKQWTGETPAAYRRRQQSHTDERILVAS